MNKHLLFALLFIVGTGTLQMKLKAASGEETSLDASWAAAKEDESLASQNDEASQFRMGRRYRDGIGVSKDEDKAREYFALAAGQGDLNASKAWDQLSQGVPAGLITVTTSGTFSEEQACQHLVDGSGLKFAIHDNDGSARTMWSANPLPKPKPPAPGLNSSPAWARFDFSSPVHFDSIALWNDNQKDLTNRGMRKVRIYGSADGTNWSPVTESETVELPRADGSPNGVPVSIPNAAPNQEFQSVIIAAEKDNGNYGGDQYGLSAVRFCVAVPGGK